VPVFVPSLLAHVIVHEITHLIKGTDEHSESGILKQRWEPADYFERAVPRSPSLKKMCSKFTEG